MNFLAETYIREMVMTEVAEQLEADRKSRDADMILLNEQELMEFLRLEKPSQVAKLRRDGLPYIGLKAGIKRYNKGDVIKYCKTNLMNL